MNIEFSTILDLKVSKENVKMIKNEIEKINDNMLEINFEDKANGCAISNEEIYGPSLHIETWYAGEINGDIGIRLEFRFYYSKDEIRKKENIENILVYINSLSRENGKNDLKALVKPGFYNLEEKYFTIIKKCLITHDFVGVNSYEIKEFVKHLNEIEESEKTVIYK